MTPKLIGSHPWLVILCYPSDQAIPGWPSHQYFRQLMSGLGEGGLFDYWNEISGGRLSIVHSKVTGWHQLEMTAAAVAGTERAQVIELARKAATRDGQDISGYLHTLVFLMGPGHFGAAGPNVISSIVPYPGQSGWRHCNKCLSLAFWDGSRLPGKCAGGDRHNHEQSSLYALAHSTPVENGEPGWRWCSKCECLIFSSTNNNACPGGGGHDLSNSANYTIRKGLKLMEEQQDWRRCDHCQNLTHAYPGNNGHCMDSFQHSYLRSDNYSLLPVWDAGAGGLAHETGHGFDFDHAFGTQREGQPGNHNRPGAYGDMTDIMSWAKTYHLGTAKFTPSSPGMSAAAVHKLGWLPDQHVARLLKGSGTHGISLQPLNSIGEGIKMIQIIVPASNSIYTVSFRQAVGFDRALGKDQMPVHLQQTLYAAGQDNWFSCASCNSMIFGGSTNCPAGGIHDGSGSMDYSVPSSNQVSGGQTGWRWCRKCKGIVFTGHGSPKSCAGGGVHDLTGSGNYSLLQQGDGQQNWFCCRKCDSLYYGGNAVKGACPAGGQHDAAGSGNYVMNGERDQNRQSNWHWCNKCQLLYFAAQGKCKGGGNPSLVGT